MLRDIWATRGVRAWMERWWMLALEVGNELGALMTRPRIRLSPPERHHLQAVVASCFDFTAAQQSRLQRHELSFRHVFLGSAAPIRRAGSHGKRTTHFVPTDRLLDAIDEATL